MESIDAILKERGDRYGDFDDFSSISQSIKYVFRNVCGWCDLSNTQAEALEMMAHKIARILNGDPDYVDSWRDVEGYAKLVADTLERQQTGPN